MITKTICCKLLTNPPSFEALKETSVAFAGACNFVLGGALEEKTHNAIKLHHLFYYEVRRLHGLSANLAVRAIGRVTASLTKLKGKENLLNGFSLKVLITMLRFSISKKWMKLYPLQLSREGFEYP